MNIDYMKRYHGNSELALRPVSTEQVSKILKYCNENKLAVVPQGGNTGLVGGSVPVYDEIILSTSLMNQIISFDPISGILVCQSGCVLQNLLEYANSQGYQIPLDLGAKGSCQIGGNVATNAGGLRFMKYGSLRQNVRGLEVVLADGTIVADLPHQGSHHRRMDINQLFIGSEGTLGVITKVALQLQPLPKSIAVAFVGCRDWDSVVQIMNHAKNELGEIVHAIEYLDRQSLEMVLSQLQYVRDPLERPCPYYVLVEAGGCNPQHDEEKLSRFIERTSAVNLIEDGTMATDPRQVSALWRLREGIPPALRRAGRVYKYDLTLGLEMMPRLVSATRDHVKSIQSRHNVQSSMKVMGFGHLADGNLHLNISAPEVVPSFSSEIDEFVYGWTARHGGSTSAEHGIGRAKSHHVALMKDATHVEVMRSLKMKLDPVGILNPYKMLCVA
eukprot:TRINITY_DN4820_c0_g1_i8.p1 TRINITY_DN4820_c0_g1~~TRINITY_DN4820_c0_g1_i8.p1  ORF type:complete len:444 (+),score=72.84 TRINITY_DN4820_c0_g1_i8:232-1563(+)